MKKKRDRTIEILRREYPGVWVYEGNTNYARADGLKIYARSHCTIGVNGGETYYSRWYMEQPDGKVEYLSLGVENNLFKEIR